MINRRFLFFKKEEDFLSKKDEILNNSIVFVEDERYIWTHGEKYVCNEENLLNLIDDKVDKEAFDNFVNNNFYGFTTWTNSLLSQKVNKQQGKSLSSNDFTDELLNKLNSLEQVEVDTQLDTRSENPVQNKVVTAALNSKVDKTTLESNYYNRNQAQQVFQQKLQEGRGISISDNVISSTLDVEPYVVVSDIYAVENPNPNKIYLQENTSNDSYSFDQYKYINGEWAFLSKITPSIDLVEYLRAEDAQELYQPAGEYVTPLQLVDYATIQDIRDTVALFNNYQVKGDYATKKWVNDYYVEHDDVYTVNDSSSHGSGSGSSGDSSTNTYDSSVAGGYKLVTLTTAKYDRLTELGLIDEKTYYFTYEGEEEITWGFGDTFPVILTDSKPSEWTFPITLTDGSTPDSIGTFPINLT